MLNKLMILGFIFLSLSAGIANAFTGGAITGTCEEADCLGTTTTGPLESVPIALKDQTGAVILTTVCDTSGTFVFADIPAGAYVLETTNLPGYTSVSPDTVPVTVTAGSTVSGIPFVDMLLTSVVKGTAFIDIDCDGAGERPHPGCTIELCDNNRPGRKLQIAENVTQRNHDLLQQAFEDMAVKEGLGQADTYYSNEREGDFDDDDDEFLDDNDELVDVDMNSLASDASSRREDEMDARIRQARNDMDMGRVTVPKELDEAHGFADLKSLGYHREADPFAGMKHLDGRILNSSPTP